MGNHRDDAININLPVDAEPEMGRINILSDKYISLSGVWNAVLEIVRWPIGFFTLSKEDRLKAGIYMGDEERGVLPAQSKGYEEH